MRYPNQQYPTGGEPGTRYGALVVVRPVSVGRKARILFQCDCGKTHEALLNQVKSSAKKGNTPSCGCVIRRLKSENGMRRFQPENYLLNRYGRLLVTGVEADPARRGAKNRLVCLCDCGAQKVVAPVMLTTGKTQSCGCLHKEVSAQCGRESVVHANAASTDKEGTPIYKAWLKIRAGCLEGWRKGAHLVCHEYDERWEDFREFLTDFGPIGYHQTISRTDNQKPWSKENCFVNVGRRGLTAKRLKNEA